MWLRDIDKDERKLIVNVNIALTLTVVRTWSIWGYQESPSNQIDVVADCNVSSKDTVPVSLGSRAVVVGYKTRLYRTSWRSLIWESALRQHTRLLLLLLVYVADWPIEEWIRNRNVAAERLSQDKRANFHCFQLGCKLSCSFISGIFRSS